MENLPNENISKAELIQKHINELTQLKRQVLQKRHDLRALGAKDEHITTENIVKEDKRKEREGKLLTAKKEKTEKVASVSAPPPTESPFIDPNAKAVKPTVEASVSKPIPIPVQAPAPTPAIVNKPPPLPAAVRVGHNGRFF